MRAQVTSKGGTTERAMEVLEAAHVKDILAALRQRFPKLPLRSAYACRHTP